MSNFGVIQQGKFTSNGKTKRLNIRSDVDFIEVFNETASAYDTDTNNVNDNFRFTYQRGQAVGGGTVYTKLNATNNPITVAGITAPAGFKLIDEGQDAFLSSANAYTAVSNSTTPTVTSGVTWTASLAAGDVIRLYQTSAQRATSDGLPFLAMDFQLSAATADTSFVIDHAWQQAPGAGSTTVAGTWRKVNIQSPYYPPNRFIVNIENDGTAIGTLTSSATAPVVVTSVDHGLQIGQRVIFRIPSSLNGMVEANNLEADITALDSSNPQAFQCNLDTTGFTAFAFPTIAQVAGTGFTPAQIIPKGVDSSIAYANNANVLADANENVLIVGVELGGGLRDTNVQTASAGPAGHYDTNLAVGDVMYYRCWKAYSVDNE